MKPVGFVTSCFREKFGIPRQPGLAPAAEAAIHLPRTPEMQDAVRGLEGFSHLWVIFLFHGIEEGHWKPLVRPPRLGGAKKIGVFATRSPHRPNPIGISAVELSRIAVTESEIQIHLRGADLLDGTPVLDIKPYVSYADSIPHARNGWVELETDARLQEISWAPSVLSRCQELEREGYPNLKLLIEQVLGLDPRPAFQLKEKDDEASDDYAVRLHDFDIHWTISLTSEGHEHFTVREIRDLRLT